MELPGIDTDIGLSMLGNNVKIYRKLLKSFSEIHALTGLHLLEAFNSGDRLQIIRLAHTLKSISGTLGAGEMRANAETLERIFKKNETSKLGELEALSNLLGSFEKVLMGIHRVTQPLPVSISTPNGENAEKVIRKLQRLLNEADTRSIRIFHKHRENLEKLLPHTILETLAEQLSRYNMEKAGEILSEFIYNRTYAKLDDHP